MESRLQIKQYKVLASTPEKRLCYSKGRIWLEGANHVRTDVHARLSVLSGCRLAERFLRLTPRLGFTIYGEFYFTAHGWLYHVDEKAGEAREVHQFRPGMKDPLTFCKQQSGGQEAVYWGEYWQNPAREPVNVFKFDGSQVTTVCTFSGIKHIHAVVWDQYRDCFWITTGDSDAESRICRASAAFDSLETVFSGQQIYRTCALFPVEKGLIYATDSPLGSNSLLFSEIKQDRFSEPAAAAAMPGPCIFSQEFRGDFYFSTSVEPNPDQPFIRYYLSRRISPGNTDKKSHVIRVTKDLETSEIFRAEKDIHSMVFFQLGNIQLSYDAMDDALAAYCISLKKHDGQTVYLTAPEKR